jgi:membrane-associated protease RseP (regulator of RpoE activity)
MSASEKKIIHIIGGSPAQKAGLRVGDEITGVDGRPATGFSLSELIALIRGIPGSKVEIDVDRIGHTNPVRFSITRERLSPLDSKLASNPMREGGIVLSGTQKSPIKSKESRDGAHGIITGEDIAGLDFSKTWLVTLSTCDSGIGRVQHGEGIFGLRRAFKVTGAQNLLTTLWPVGDAFTPSFMRDFYKESIKTHDALVALAKVQKEWLLKIRRERGLGAAVRDAGPFALSTTGSTR